MPSDCLYRLFVYLRLLIPFCAAPSAAPAAAPSLPHPSSLLVNILCCFLICLCCSPIRLFLPTAQLIPLPSPMPPMLLRLPSPQLHSRHRLQCPFPLPLPPPFYPLLSCSLRSYSLHRSSRHSTRCLYIPLSLVYYSRHRSFACLFRPHPLPLLSRSLRSCRRLFCHRHRCSRPSSAASATQPPLLPLPPSPLHNRHRHSWLLHIQPSF